MKARYFFFVLTVLAVSIVSCTREDGKDTAVEGPILTFTAIHADSKDTKTALQDNGTSIWWTSNEQINIFYGTKFKGQFSSGNSESQATTTFSGSLTVVTGSIESGAADAYWAVYPYSEDNTCDGESVTLTVPSTQTGVAGTFADNFFPAIATSTTLDLAFYNVCGGARFSVSQTGITSIKVSSKNATPIAGKVRVGFGANGKPEVKEVLAGESEITLTAPAGGFVPGEYYYAALLPGTHTDGLDVIFEKDDNTMGIYQISKNLEVHRAVFGKLSDLDNGLSFGPNPKAAIQFEDPAAKYACLEKFDANGDGEVSYEEAATATSLSGLFKDWDTVTRFEEIKYFIGVTSTIGVFDNLAKLESITIPDHITTLGTFQNCSSLESVTLPLGATSLPSYCFDGCTSLTYVTLPAAITSIPDYCFRECSSLVNPELPSGVKNIGHKAFQNCSSITSSELPATLTTIGQYAFSGCTSLVSVILPSNLTNIGRYAFNGCSDLVSAVLPSDMTSIPEGLFSGCTLLGTITWPSALHTIGDKAFSGCRFKGNDDTLELPSTVTSIGSSAFGKLRHLIIPSTSAVSIASNSFMKGTLLYVPASMVDMYKVRTNWSMFADSIYSIGEYPVPEMAVDLGLPSGLKWASRNVGAFSPEDYEDYYAWGETQTKDDYSWSTYKYELGTDHKGPFSKYVTQSGFGTVDNKTVLDPEDDAAHVNWGGNWRMPTDEEWTELRENCTWEWTDDYNGTRIAGQIVSSSNGNSIFLPAAGWWDGTKVKYVGSGGYYWSSSLDTLYPRNVCSVYICSSLVRREYFHRCYGFSVRPVCEQ